MHQRHVLVMETERQFNKRKALLKIGVTIELREKALEKPGTTGAAPP